MSLHPTNNDGLIGYLSGLDSQIDLWSADPSWPYLQTGGGDPRKFRSTAKREYSCESYADIAHTLARAATVSSPDAVLCLWVTAPQSMDVARRVVIPLENWGSWRYQAKVFWHKTGTPGIGQWLRNDVEELWILSRSGRLPAHLRGQLKPGSKAPCFRNWLETAPPAYECSGRKGLEHSEKPEKLERQVIARFCPPGGTVGSLWSGLYPTGRACRTLGLTCYGAEPDPDRHALAIQKMETVCIGI